MSIVSDEYANASVSSNINIHFDSFNTTDMNKTGFYVGIPLTEAFGSLLLYDDEQPSKNMIEFHGNTF